MTDASKVARLQPFTLGDWLVDPMACRVSRGDTVVKLRPQLVDLLTCLAAHADRIVLKEEILAEVWPGQYIADSGLSRCIAELRQTLQDDAAAPRYIETIPKRGYRLVAAVGSVPPPDASLAPAGGRFHANEAAASTVTTPPEGLSGVEGHPAAAVGAAPGAPAGSRRRAVSATLAILLVLAAGIVTMVMLARARAGHLTDRDPVLLAFENRTGDAVFDEIVPLAISIQLEQSPHLALLSPGRVREILQMMKRAPETAITRAVGLEVCERAGARAVIVTSIALLGSQYAMGLEAVACRTGEVLARRRVTTDRKEQVLAGLERAAQEIRAAVGEPGAMLARYNVPTAEATTASLEALRAFSGGEAARDRGERAVALDFYRQAVALDPDFALAQLRRGAAARLHGTEAESRAALDKAFALRDRVTVPERLEIAFTYHRYVTGDQGKIFEALDLLRSTYPRRAWVRHVLALEYQQTGQHDAALAEALVAQRLEPDSPRVLGAVANSYLCFNRVAEAREAAERGIALSPNHPALHLVLFRCGLVLEDADVLARERAWAAEHFDAAAPFMSQVEADHALGQGRLREALRFLGEEEAWATSGGRPTVAMSARLWMARYEALAGFRERAVRRLDEELRRGVAPEVLIEAVKAAVAAGDDGRTARLLDEVERHRVPGAQPDAAFVRAYRAAADARQNRLDEALAGFAQLEPLDLGFLFEYIPLFERAQANYLAGNWEAARAAFEKLLANPNIGADRKLLPLAELGLARTHARRGDIPGSRRAYAQLFARWREADPDLPVLLEARREYAALAK